MNKPLLVGITGGIGAGKSTVARVFGLLGVPLYKADDRAKALMEEDRQLQAAIINLFGSEAYKNGRLNRTYLAGRVFADPQEVAKLNDLVHPAVARDFAAWCSHQPAPYVLKEAALLFESGSYRQLDATILVEAPVAMRLQRVLARDPQRSEEQVRQIMDKQIDPAVATRLADYRIINDESQLVIPQVLSLHQQLLARAGL